MTGRNGTILRTTDGGNNWFQQTTRTWYDVSSVCFIDVNNGDYGLIMATTNGGGIVSVENNDNKSTIPSKYLLSQNFPNPFNPSTTISWQIPESGLVTLKIYDVLGREVTTLVSEELSAGKHETVFDASRFSSGVYFYQLKTRKFIKSKKMVLLK